MGNTTDLSVRFKDYWDGFKPGEWQEGINTRDFIMKNFTPYSGGPEFLCGPTERTKALNAKLGELFKKERENGGVLDINTEVVSSLCNYPAAYLDKENELIVGYQTDAPLRRGVNPFGGIRMARGACEAYGYKLSQSVEEHFEYRTTHNDGVFRVYTDEMKLARHIGIITGLPDAYGRGRIIGDYRRVALYGVDYLIEQKQLDKKKVGENIMDVDTIRLSEELFQQINFLKKMKEMAAMYGYDISMPAKNTREAIQWTYFAYLASIKEQNGAAMSLGRTSTFFDIYVERDMKRGILTEEQAQELIDDFVMKLRSARHLRTPEYNELFGGDPMWITESVGGVNNSGVPLVTKGSYRMLNTLYNLGSSPEPNLTILWSERLPEPFKKFCAKLSVDTDSIQYENDDLMRMEYGDDYAIACCVSAMTVGKQMQFFGARANMAKSLLYAINGGVDELKGTKVVPGIEPITDEVLDFDKVMANYKKVLSYVAGLYVDAVNIIHFMHDKYAYEASQMALHDTHVERLMAFGMAGLSVAADSLSAIKFAKVKPIRNHAGIAVDFTVKGDFPKYGNDDDRVDDLAVEAVTYFSNELKKHPLYRNAKHTLSALTITSNVMYGKKTGPTPDGRKVGEPLAPGANPMHGRDENGALASLNSVAKIPYRNVCQDGVSNTFSIVPNALGKTETERENNLVTILDGYFAQGAHHLNVNVLNRQLLIDAMEHPEQYPTLTIRVSGYAVNFNRLSREQQLEVISRTFHESI